MIAEEYRNLCQRPDVLSRFLIDATARLLPPDSLCATGLRAILREEPLPKPALHQGEKDTDRFQVNLSAWEADEIVDVLVTLEAEAVSLDGETTPDASFIAGIGDVWANYSAFKSEGARHEAI